MRVLMEAASALWAGQARPRSVLVVRAFVVGWSVGRVTSRPRPANEPEQATPAELPLAAHRVHRFRKPVRLALTGVAVAVVFAGAGLALRPSAAAAPLVDRALATQQRIAAQNARVTLLRHLQTAGIAGRRNGVP